MEEETVVTIPGVFDQRMESKKVCNWTTKRSAHTFRTNFAAAGASVKGIGIFRALQTNKSEMRNPQNVDSPGDRTELPLINGINNTDSTTFTKGLVKKYTRTHRDTNSRARNI